MLFSTDFYILWSAWNLPPLTSAQMKPVLTQLHQTGKTGTQAISVTWIQHSHALCCSHWVPGHPEGWGNKQGEKGNWIVGDLRQKPQKPQSLGVHPTGPGRTGYLKLSTSLPWTSALVVDTQFQTSVCSYQRSISYHIVRNTRWLYFLALRACLFSLCAFFFYFLKYSSQRLWANVAQKHNA